MLNRCMTVEVAQSARLWDKSLTGQFQTENLPTPFSHPRPIKKKNKKKEVFCSN